MEQDGIHELTAAYALDALDPADEADYEAHLARCAACQDELASLQATASALAYASEAPPPPSALRARILAQARRERPNVVPLRSRWSVPALAGATAVAACVALALGIWAYSLSSSLAEEREARADEQRAFAVLSDPDATRTALAGANGTLVVSTSGDAALVVSGLDAAPEDKIYEAWVIEDGDPQPAGLFDAGAERTVVALTRAVPRDAIVAVTLEDEKGAEKPTTSPLFTAKPA